jgi:hypothetical protein
MPPAWVGSNASLGVSTRFRRASKDVLSASDCPFDQFLVPKILGGGHPLRPLRGLLTAGSEMTHDAAVIGIKALFGGTMVMVFAVIGHILRPKWFAGLFSAAPSVAVASLAVIVVDKGHHVAASDGYAMLFGVAGFVVFAALVRPLLSKVHALVASSICCLVWVAVAVGGYRLVVG